MRRVLRAIALLGLLASFHAVADETDKAKANCIRAQLRGLWPVESRTLAVIVSSEFDRELGGCVRSFRVLDEASSSSEKSLFVEAMAEHPVAIWPIGKRLLTIWESGSALLVAVYSIDNAKVRKVLEVRPRGFPEVVFSKDGSEKLIFTNYEREVSDTKSAPKTSDIYAWAKGKYVVRTSVPWSRRFDETK